MEPTNWSTGQSHGNDTAMPFPAEQTGRDYPKFVNPTSLQINMSTVPPGHIVQTNGSTMSYNAAHPDLQHDDASAYGMQYTTTPVADHGSPSRSVASVSGQSSWPVATASRARGGTDLRPQPIGRRDYTQSHSSRHHSQLATGFSSENPSQFPTSITSTHVDERQENEAEASWDDEDEARCSTKANQSLFRNISRISKQPGSVYVTEALSLDRRKLAHEFAKYKNCSHFTFGPDTNSCMFFSADAIDPAFQATFKLNQVGRHGCWSRSFIDAYVLPNVVNIEDLPFDITEDEVRRKLLVLNLPPPESIRISQAKGIGARAVAIFKDAAGAAKTVEELHEKKIRPNDPLRVRVSYERFFVAPSPIALDQFSAVNTMTETNTMNNAEPSYSIPRILRNASPESNPTMAASDGQPTTSLNGVLAGTCFVSTITPSGDGHTSVQPASSALSNTLTQQPTRPENDKVKRALMIGTTQLLAPPTATTSRSRSNSRGSADGSAPGSSYGSECASPCESVTASDWSGTSLIARFEELDASASPNNPKKRKRHQSKKDHFKCEGCDKLFDRLCDRTKHEKHHLLEGQRPFECPMCDHDCVERKDVRRHLEGVHKIPLESAREIAAKLSTRAALPRPEHTQRDVETRQNLEAKVNNVDGTSLYPADLSIPAHNPNAQNWESTVNVAPWDDVLYDP